MTLENLYTFTPDDWKIVENQFTGFSGATVQFVTENKGSIQEASDIYVEAFIYYTQLLELHGFKRSGQAEEIIYSFARKLWLQKLRKRNVDVNYVKHNREFFEMEDAFHEIDAIKERSEKTAGKLAEIGEPFRTLLLEHVGRRKELLQVGMRLGYADEEKAFSQVVKSLRKLIKLSEGKEFEISDMEFSKFVRYVLDNHGRESQIIAEEDKICVTMISRTVAMLRNYITRNQRMQLLKEMQLRLEPSHLSAIEPAHKSNRKMKPLAVFIMASTIAVAISAITAFSISEAMLPGEPETALPADTLETQIVQEIVKPQIEATAFAIDHKGFLLTSAKAVYGEDEVLLENESQATPLKGKIVFCDTVSGVAIIHSSAEVGQKLPYRFSPDVAKIGQPIFSVGYPETGVFYDDGTLNSCTAEGMGKVKLDAGILGAPVLSDKGQIIGMITAHGEKASDLVQASLIKSKLDEYAASAAILFDLPKRNGLFYSDRIEQIEKITPHVFRVKIIDRETLAMKDS